MSDPGPPIQADPGVDVARIAARAHERDRYLSALLAPRAAREDLIALAAFAGEVARIPPMVSEPMMGEIRLQWWRDTLNLPPGVDSGHPVADRLRAAVTRRNLPAGLLAGFIDAHRVALYNDLLPDEPALHAYLARTEGALFELALRILGRHDATAHAVSGAAGLAYGLARTLTELPALLSQGRTLIPESRLALAGLSLAELTAPSTPDGTATRVAALIREIIRDARRALAEVRRLAARLNRAQRVAILPVALVEPYLRSLEGSVQDPLRITPVLTPLQRIWPLWRAYWSGRL